MPVRPENRALYPADWFYLARRLKIAADERCQGSPAYPDCRAEAFKAHPVTGSRVILTVAHLDHRPENCALENLRVWCQRCHNTYDARHRAAARRGRLQDPMQMALPLSGKDDR